MAFDSSRTCSFECLKYVPPPTLYNKYLDGEKIFNLKEMQSRVNFTSNILYIPPVDNFPSTPLCHSLLWAEFNHFKVIFNPEKMYS